MIRVTLIALGRLKEKYLRDACDEYAKRLSRYCSLDIVEMSPCMLPERPSAGQVSAALEKEAQLILKRIPKDAFIAALCVEGKQMPSERFSETLIKMADSGKNLCFIIGSSYGLADSVKSRADIRLSLSEMTFPHQLFRVMLLEQIYRGFKISEGSTYHK